MSCNKYREFLFFWLLVKLLHNKFFLDFRIYVLNSTNDIILSIRQSKEKCNEHNILIYVAFNDFNNVFDLGSRENLLSYCLRILLTILPLINQVQESSSIQELMIVFSNLKNFTQRDLLFFDDAALVAHSAQILQTLLSLFPLAYSDFRLKVRL